MNTKPFDYKKSATLVSELFESEDNRLVFREFAAFLERKLAEEKNAQAMQLLNDFEQVYKTLTFALRTQNDWNVEK